MTQTEQPQMTMAERLAAITESLLPAEYFAADRIADAAQHQLAGMTPPPPPAPELDPFVCGEISDTWIDQTIERETRQTLLDKKHHVLGGLARDARTRATSIRDAQKPRILRAYNGELQALMAEVEQVSDQLGAADTAAAAITNDVGHAWKRLTELADDYAQLRRAQRALTPTQTVFDSAAAWGEPHASDLYLKNLDALWPHWRTGQGEDHVIHVNGDQDRCEPWPQDQTEIMLWLVRSDAQPWIPTEQQLEQLQQDRIARDNPMPKVIPGRRDLLNNLNTDMEDSNA
jgi:hypothetical protein